MKIRYRNIVAIIYTIVLFIDRLDLTIVNIILPGLAKYFDIPVASTDWISMSFLLALAMSIPISSWLGDRFGLKKIYVGAIFLFGIASSLCSLANDFNSLVFLRFFQGIGGGLLLPVGMTMLYRNYRKSEYASITSFTFLPSLIAPAIAPFFGGILLDHFGWRSVFLFSGPIAIILGIVASIFLKESSYRVKNNFDWLGFLLSSSMLINIFYIFSTIGSEGLSLNFFIGCISFLFFLKSFLWWEKRFNHPLIDLSFFKNDTFIRANLIQICFQTCHFGFIFLVGIYLQAGLGMSATIAGLIMGMQAFGAMSTSRYSVKLFNKYGPKVPIISGLIGIGVLTPCIMFIENAEMITFGVSLFFIRGIFSGLCGAPIQTLSVLDFSKEEIGQVNSIFNACRQVAISFGIAFSSILLSAGLRINNIELIGSINYDQCIKAFSLSFGVIPVIALIGILIIKGLKTELGKKWTSQPI